MYLGNKEYVVISGLISVLWSSSSLINMLEVLLTYSRCRTVSANGEKKIT